MINYPITRFVSLELALKEIAPFIRNGKYLLNGKPIKRFGGMLPREMLANWLVCVAANATGEVKLTFLSDPVGGDGVLYDEKTRDTWPTEHVMVPPLRSGQTGDGHSLVVDAVQKKCRKGGAAYARGKTLIVFMEAGTGVGAWYPNRIARGLPNPLHFGSVWIVALQGIEDGEYVYGVSLLDVGNSNAPTFRVRINRDFTSWQVTREQ